MRLGRAGARGVLAAIAVLAASMAVGFVAQASPAAVVEVSATSPHVADARDRSLVLVTATDSSGLPVDDADIELHISPPTFANQLAHFVLHLSAEPVGSGQYVASFASPVQGPIAIVATDRESLATDLTFVEFTPPPTSSSLATRRAPGGIGAQDLKDDCKRYFDDLDNEFYPPILAQRFQAEPDPAKKAALRQRLEDLGKSIQVIEADIALESKVAKGQTPTQAERDALEAAKQAAKGSFERLSMAQEAQLKRFFGDPVDFSKFQKCTELFNNFELVDDFAKAVERIKKARELVDKLAHETDPAKRQQLAQELRALGRVAERGPDSAIAHIRWAKFANIAIDLNVATDLWRNLKPILVKGSAITVAVLSDNDASKGGIQPAKQSERAIEAIRAMFDPLRPQPGDSEAEKQRKLEELEKKLIELIKTIVVDRKVIAQLPGRDGGATLSARVQRASCPDGHTATLDSAIGELITIARIGHTVFGFGADSSGATYVAIGSTDGRHFSMTVSGFGLSPTAGPAVSSYTGTVAGSTVRGSWSGVGSALPGEPDAACMWSGPFTLVLGAPH
jgi:hypothetical protein